jgi:hypothetical protein
MLVENIGKKCGERGKKLKQVNKDRKDENNSQHQGGEGNGKTERTASTLYIQ